MVHCRNQGLNRYFCLLFVTVNPNEKSNKNCETSGIVEFDNFVNAVGNQT